MPILKPWRPTLFLSPPFLRPTKPRLFNTTHPSLNPKPLILPPRLTIPEQDFTETFLKGSGPGGQKINKTSSAVQLKHVATGIVVKSQATRSRDQNRKIARRLLGERVEEWVVEERRRGKVGGDEGLNREGEGARREGMETGEEGRETAMERAGRVKGDEGMKTRKEIKGEVKRKKKASKGKKARRKYRKLAEGEDGDVLQDGDDGEEEAVGGREREVVEKRM